MNRWKPAAALCMSAMLHHGASAQVLDQGLKILPDDGGVADQFGYSIAISDGVVAVGSVLGQVNGVRTGAAYLFDAPTGVQSAKLASDDGGASDFFSHAIAMDNAVVAVGAPFADGSAGSAYLFDASTGVQYAKLLPADVSASDLFGISVSISDGIVAVGASRDADNGPESGSVYLFDAISGAERIKLLPDDGAEEDFFGEFIAISGGVIAVGAPGNDDNGSGSGSVYLFDAVTGVQYAKLLPDDGGAGDAFGRAVAIDDGVVAVGAPHDDDNGSLSGSVYLFDAASGDQLVKLLPAVGAEGDRFGDSVAIGGGVLAVGASGSAGGGSAYLFDVSTQAQIARLLPEAGAAGSLFGMSIAIDDGIVAVGASGDDEGGPASGAAYLFDTNPCSPADLAFPPGVLDFSDVSTFLAAFGTLDPIADLAPPLGVLDFSDAVIFLTAFGAGCP